MAKFNPLKSLNESNKYIGLGADIIAPILLGALVGHFIIDKNNNTSPKWTVILVIFGFIVGMYNLFKTTMKINQESQDAKKKK